MFVRHTARRNLIAILDVVDEERFYEYMTVEEESGCSSNFDRFKFSYASSHSRFIIVRSLTFVHIKRRLKVITFMDIIISVV